MRSARVRTMACATALLSLLLLLLLVSPAAADKFDIDYRRELGNALVFGEPQFVRAIGMYAEGDSAWGTAFAKQPSSIQLRLYATELTEQLRLVDPYENELGAFNESNGAAAASSQKLIDELDYPTSDYTHAGFIQATILQAQDLDLIGLPDAEAPLTSIETYCCTPFYVDQGMCAREDLGALIIDRNVSAFDIWTYDLALLPRRSGADPAKWVERQSAHRVDRDETQRATYTVRATGEHVLILSHCDPTLNTEVAVSGITEWRNPFGFLPGRLYGFLNFHKYMLAFYVLFALVWLGLNVKRRADVTSLQLYTSLVIFLCVCEQLTWFSEYTHFNNVGTRHLAVISFAVVLSVLRQTVSRALIMLVALGLHIVKPNLGDNKVKLIALSVAYFVLECALELVVRYQQTHPLNDYYRILLTLPVAITNATFYWWIFIAFYELMQHMEERKLEMKFALYRSFTNILLCSSAAALAFALYQSYFMLTNQYAWHWSYLWIIDGGFSFMLYTVILVSIAVLFRPSPMWVRYSYAPVGLADEEDEELTSLEMAARGEDHTSPSPTSSASANAMHMIENYADDEADARRFQKEQADKGSN